MLGQLSSTLQEQAETIKNLSKKKAKKLDTEGYYFFLDIHVDLSMCSFLLLSHMMF